MSDTVLLLEFLRLFDGPFDTAVHCNDVPIEKDAVSSRYRHGGDQRVLQPFPFIFDTFAVAAFLVGVDIINQDKVRTHVLVTGTARGLSRSDGAEGTSGSQRKFSRLPFAQFSLWTVILDDSLVFFEVRHKG